MPPVWFGPIREIGRGEPGDKCKFLKLTTGSLVLLPGDGIIFSLENNTGDSIRLPVADICLRALPDGSERIEHRQCHPGTGTLSEVKFLLALVPRLVKDLYLLCC